MKIHIRYDETYARHTQMTVFINGQNTGRLCMDTQDADRFYLAVREGCENFPIELKAPLSFKGSGPGIPDEPFTLR